jgi:peptidyl-prolyl cis-trans isomerase C
LNRGVASGRDHALLVAVAWLVFWGCSRQPEDDAGRGPRPPSLDALAQVNQAELREEDLRQLIPAEFRDSVTGAEIRGLLDRWIETELLYQRAVKKGLEQDPQVAEKLQQTQRQILADEFLQRELKERVRVSNEEVQAYYDSNIGMYTQEVQLRHILVNSPDEALQVLAQLRAGGDFRALAQRYSVDPTAARGGDLGYLGKGAMNPAFESVVFQMAPGEVRGPIASGFGFHIVQVVARRRAAEPLSFELVRDEILQSLLLRKQSEAAQALIAELREAAHIFMAKSYAGMLLEPEVATPAEPDTSELSFPDMPIEDTSGSAPPEP